jgi:N-acetylneuraminic acid mutarotase
MYPSCVERKHDIPRGRCNNPYARNIAILSSKKIWSVMNFARRPRLFDLLSSIPQFRSSAYANVALAFMVLVFVCQAAAQTGEWVWLSGDSYGSATGTLGVPAPGNVPGSVSDASVWNDHNGNVWSFGGWGVGQSGQPGYTNQLWEFNLTTKEWTWWGGNLGIGTGCYKLDGSCSVGPGTPGMYGTLGTPAASNIPGGRVLATSWTDSMGSLWLFGGEGYDANNSNGNLNDLWKFDPSIKQWTWMGGSNDMTNGHGAGVGHPGVYGTLGVAAAGNIPGSREGGVGLVDSNGNFWLFGGDDGPLGDHFNDLWKFNPSTNQWTWVAGSSSVTQAGVYGVLGTFAAENAPGARDAAAGWIDSKGNFWIFGGTGYDAVGNRGFPTDLWEFNSANNQWAWMDGNKMEPPCASNPYGCAGQPGVYGAPGVPAASNFPGGREGPLSWTDHSGDFWLFGGYGFDANGNYGDLNDLWEFNPSTKNWTWMSGSNTVIVVIGGSSGVYGTLGSPAAGNFPGGRQNGLNWIDGSGNLWLFGGYGLNSTGNVSNLNDLWEYQAPVAVTPTFSVSGGTYTSAQTVTISDSAPGATVYFTTDGTKPTTSSTLFISPITVSVSETVQAIAVVPNDANSEIISATYVIPPTFTVASTTTDLVVKSATQGTVNLTITPQNGFNSPVAFSCSGLPVGASCSFSPTTLTPPGTKTTILTITAQRLSASMHAAPRSFFPAAAITFGICLCGWRRRRSIRLLLLLAVFSATVFLGGCSGAGGEGTSTGPVTSMVTVTATSGSIQQSVTVSLTVD